MKKIALILIVLTVAVTALFGLTACGGTVEVPGTAWSDKEILTYDVFDGDVKTGALVTYIETLEPGDYYLTKVREEPFKVTAKVAKGIRLTMSVKDLEGKEIMYSESLMNSSTAIASYKKTSDNEIRGYYDGKRYNYSVNGGEWKRIKASSGFMDNELLYTAIRCHNLDTGYNGSFKVMNPLDNGSVNISVTTGTTAKKFTVNYVNLEKGTESHEAELMAVRISKSETPIGSPIFVYYTKEDFKIYGSVAKPTPSYHIPVEIVENNITYKLTLANSNP